MTQVTSVTCDNFVDGDNNWYLAFRVHVYDYADKLKYFFFIISMSEILHGVYGKMLFAVYLKYTLGRVSYIVIC